MSKQVHRMTVREVANTVARCFRNYAMPTQRFRNDVENVQIDRVEYNDGAIRTQGLRFMFETAGHNDVTITRSLDALSKDLAGEIIRLQYELRDMAEAQNRKQAGNQAAVAAILQNMMGTQHGH